MTNSQLFNKHIRPIRLEVQRLQAIYRDIRIPHDSRVVCNTQSILLEKCAILLENCAELLEMVDLSQTQIKPKEV